MKKLIIAILLLASTAYADVIRDTGPAQKWIEVDGSPSGRPRTIVVSPDAITFSGSIMSLDVITPTALGSTLSNDQAGCTRIGIPTIPVATWTTQCDFNSLFGSSGRASGGNVISIDAGTVSADAGTGFIKATDSDTTELLSFNWGVNSNLGVPPNSRVYIGVDYNSGSPSVVSRDTFNFDLDTDFPIASVIRENGDVHILNNFWWTTDAITNILERFRADGYIVRDSYVGGLVISVPGTRNIAVTTGTLWSNLNEFVIPAVDTSVSGTVEYYWYNGVAGEWNESDVSQYSVTQWNDTTLATLQNLTSNWYANIWVYAEADDLSISLLYPQAQYANSASADAESPPTVVPSHIQEHGLLLGRITIKQGVDAPIEIDSAFDTLFNPSQVTDHGNLAGLSDDDHTQYLLADGTRDLTGDWTIATNNIILSAGYVSVDEDGAFIKNVKGAGTKAYGLQYGGYNTGVSFAGTNFQSFTIDMKSDNILYADEFTSVLQIGNASSNYAYSFLGTGSLTVGGDVELSDDKYIGFGNTDALFEWNTTGNDHFTLGMLCNNAAYSGYLTICERADRDSANRAPASVSVNPVLRVYSSDENAANDFIELYHNQTNAVISCGSGIITFDSAVLSSISAITADVVITDLKTKTASYTLTHKDSILLCNNATSMDVTLPAATGSRIVYTVKNIGSGIVRLTTISADNIDAVSSDNIYQWDAVKVVDGASNKWYKI